MTERAHGRPGYGSTPPQLPTTLSNSTDGIFELMHDSIRAHRRTFYIYRDGDSAFNHGFPSGFFGAHDRIEADASCVDSRTAPNGCSTDPNILDRERGTVLRITFLPFQEVSFAGVNIQEPESGPDEGLGYDATGGARLVFEARSPNPDNFMVQFGAGEAETDFQALSEEWREFAIELVDDLDLLRREIANLHILFTVVTNEANAPNGGTVLLNDIRIEPVPEAQAEVPGLPLSFESFGVVPVLDPDDSTPLPPDQINRNLARTADSALAALSLLDRARRLDEDLGLELSESLLYALDNPNTGLLIPGVELADGSTVRGLHDGYSAGDLPLFNDLGDGRRGQVRFAGFTGGEQLCGPSEFCRILDGASAETNGLAILAFLSAFERSTDSVFLEAARRLAVWVDETLADPDRNGFGGYFQGFGEGAGKEIIPAKPTSANSILYAAFTKLSRLEGRRGDRNAALRWVESAANAGDFVMEMFDTQSGCFAAGTVPNDTERGAGIEPGNRSRGADVVNEFDFLDSNSLAILALAESSRYRDRIDWRAPAECIMGRFDGEVRSGGLIVSGFRRVRQPAHVPRRPEGGPNGLTWEHSAQAVLAFQAVDRRYRETRFEAVAASTLVQLSRVRESAPFGDGRGLVAATVEGGAQLPPVDQCFSTPFECVPQRVGLAATAWAGFAFHGVNPLTPLTEFYFPYLQADPDNFTGYAVSNYSGASAVFDFSAYGADGSLLPTGENPARFALTPQTQLAQLVSQILGIAAGTSETGWAAVRTDNPNLGSFFQFGDLGLNRLDGSVAFHQQRRRLFFSRAFEGPEAFRGRPARTVVYLANPNRDAVRLSLTLAGPDTAPGVLQGVSNLQTERELAPHGFLSESLSELFGEGTTVTTGHLVVEALEGKGVIGFQLIELIEQQTLIGLNALAPASSSNQFSAQFASAENLYSNLNLINTGEEIRMVTISAVDENGSSLGDSAEIELEPGEQFSADARDLFPSMSPTGGNANAASFVGSLQVASDGPSVIGDVIFGQPASLRFSAALSLQSETFTEAVFSQVANVPGFFTGLAFYNPGELDAQLSITVFSSGSLEVGRATRELGAGRRFSQLAPELVPTSAGQAGGYILIQSDRPLVAQQLFGAVDEQGVRLLSAVPPERIQ